MGDAPARLSAVTNAEWPGLAATLAAFDDDALVRLLALRPDLARPAPRDLAALASRAGAWPSARDAFAGLDRAARRVIEALCLVGRPATVAELASMLGVDGEDADLASALDRLAERTLAFAAPAPAAAGGTVVRLLPALRQLEYPARLGPPLASVTSGPPGSALEPVAVRLGAVPGRTNAATLAAIVDVLADPGLLAAIVAQGPPGTAELARRVATEGPLVRVEGGVYRVDDRTPAGWLLNRRILVIVDYFTALMPREAAVSLRGGRAFPPDCLRAPALGTTPVDPAAVDRAAAERALRVVADVATLLELWDAEPPALLKAGGLGIREVHRVAKAIGDTDTAAARIADLAALAGLVAADHLSGAVLPTVAGDEWLGLEAPYRWAHLAAAWLAAGIHLSLAGAIGPKAKPIPPLLDRGPERDAARRRRTALAVLEAVAAGAAPVVAGVRDQLDWAHPALWSGGPASAEMLVDWVLEEANLLGVAAIGALSSAGRAVLAGDAALAAASLAALAPPTVTEFVVQADLTAVVAGEPAPAVKAELDLLADVESKGAATVYRFSEGSLRRAFDAGRTSADIVEFLERNARRGVPQPLTYLVTDLGRRFGNVRVGAVASYVRSDEPSLLAEVLQAKRTARLRLRRLAPTVLVTDVDATTVTTTLQAAGYLPAQEGADGALVLARAPTRRAPARRPHAQYAPTDPDLVAIVDDLRRHPVPAAAGPAPGWSPVAAVAPRLPPATRPTQIVKDRHEVRAVLSDACDECWVVRLSYVNSQGNATELTVEPTDLDRAKLYAACWPRGNERSFIVDHIEWVRVLTEAEEDLLP